MFEAVPVIDETLNALDPGEQAAITLAQTLPADLLTNYRLTLGTTDCLGLRTSYYRHPRYIG